jgi:[acyl-carrier-protein] S-malonyltransferase
MKKVGFIFPGQGSQYAGMGKEFYDQFRIAREVFEEADDSLSFSISNICFQGSEDELKLTENTQPAVLTVSIAILRVLEEETGLVPELSAGHSLGEYSALVNSDCLKFSDAVRIVRLRGRFMQEAVPLGEGAMAAILGMGRQEVESLCEEVSKGDVISPANFNCPGQIVIAGHSKAIKRAVEKVKQNGKKAVLLSVSAPFHSPLMKPAGLRLEEALREIPVRELKIPVVANLDAEINT